jgi:hypothetical protein
MSRLVVTREFGGSVKKVQITFGQLLSAHEQAEAAAARFVKGRKRLKLTVSLVIVQR